MQPLPSGTGIVDYAIVARLLPERSGSGKLTLVTAGMTPYGSVAASEFLTHSASFRVSLKGGPARWELLNMQVVLRVRVVGTTPAPPEVVATHFW